MGGGSAASPTVGGGFYCEYKYHFAWSRHGQVNDKETNVCAVS